MKRVQTYIYTKKHRSGNMTYVVRYKDAQSNKWVAISAGASKQEALIYEAKIRQELFAGIDPRDSLQKLISDITIAELIKYFYKNPRFLGMSLGSQDNIRSFLERIILPQWGKVRFSLIKDEHFFNLYEFLRGKGLVNNTIRKHHHILSSMFGSYCESQPDLKNPMDRLPSLSKIAPKQAPSRDINFLIPEEVEMLLVYTEQSSSKLLHPFVQFLAFTGMRRSEALNLKWTDVDEQSGFFHIRKSKNQRSRSIPIEERALSAIKVLQGNGQFIFSYKDGTQPYQDSFLKPLKVALKHAGITKRVDLHTLRHSYGSNKLRAGWGLKKVSKLLGHSNIQMTAEVYSHLLDGDLKIADQLSFDNQPKANSIREEEMANAIVKALQSLGTTGSNVLNAILPVKTQEAREVQLQTEKALVAPHVLREYNDNSASKEKTKGQSLKILNDSVDLGSKKMADPKGLEPMTSTSVV